MKDLANLIGLEEFAPDKRKNIRSNFSHGGKVSGGFNKSNNCPTSILMDSIRCFDEGGSVPSSPFYGRQDTTQDKTTNQKVMKSLDTAGHGIQDAMDFGMQAKFMYEQQKAMAAANKAAEAKEAAEKLAAEKAGANVQNPNVPQEGGNPGSSQTPSNSRRQSEVEPGYGSDIEDNSDSDIEDNFDDEHYEKPTQYGPLNKDQFRLYDGKIYNNGTVPQATNPQNIPPFDGIENFNPPPNGQTPQKQIYGGQSNSPYITTNKTGIN